MPPRHAHDSARRWPLALPALCGLLSCGDVQARRPRAEVVAAAPARAIAAGGAADGRLHALLVNGGGSPDDNFKSHLLHLREMQALLATAGVSGERLTVVASDGADDRPDVAVRAPVPEGFWLLEGTALGRQLEEPLRYEDSVLPGVTLRPATRAGLRRSLDETRRRLVAGDTLLLYVTDHGKDDPRDPRGNHITLWGPRENLTVRQLSSELGKLPAGVRVVAVMSQCFSGGFAHLIDGGDGQGLPSGDVCGYFATTADRPAFGCYPEATDEDRVGHSFAFIDALKSNGGSLSAAHRQVLRSDQTPDVPLRTTDAFLAARLRLAASAAGVDDVAFADGQLQAARGTEEVALADDVATTFGLPRPATLKELAASLEEMTTLRQQLESYQELWQTALGDMTRSNVDRFLTQHARWRERLHPRLLRRLEDGPRRALAGELLQALASFAEQSGDDRARLERLVQKVDAAASAGYRMEVREAALLRMRALLTSAAGRAYLTSRGTDAERASLAALSSCESLTLPGLTGGSPAPAAPYPPLDEDRRLTASLRPSWLGIAFKPVSPAMRGRLRAGEGAALLTAVEPGSPAAVGGLRPGDVILGPPGARFDRENQVRSFTMLADAGQPLALQVVRGGQRQTVEVRPARFPLQPGPAQERKKAK